MAARTTTIIWYVGMICMNDKLEAGNNNLTCLFTENDWKEWEVREDRNKEKKKRILTPEMIKSIRRDRYNRRWKYGCDLCKSRSTLVRGIKQHYRYTHGKYISGNDVRKNYRIRGRV